MTRDELRSIPLQELIDELVWRVGPEQAYGMICVSAWDQIIKGADAT
jgi:hypothetical protein